VRPSDFAFANDLRAATELQAPRTLMLIIRASLAFLVVALVWAHFAIIDEVTRATARVIPSRQMCNRWRAGSSRNCSLRKGRW
jgi:adhesin transport system membrane fusion protein